MPNGKLANGKRIHGKHTEFIEDLALRAFDGTFEFSQNLVDATAGLVVELVLAGRKLAVESLEGVGRAFEGGADGFEPAVQVFVVGKFE